MSTETASLPPRLSDQQQFILATIADETDDYDPAGYAGTDEQTRAMFRVLASLGYPVSRLSWKVAEEFDEDDRILDRRAAREDLAEDADSFHEVNRLSLLLSVVHAGMDDRALSREHRASFSRALARLEDRGLLTRQTWRYADADSPHTRWVEPTESGREAGHEVRRRHSDGRYSLSFQTSPWA